MIKFFTQSVFPYLVSASIATMVAVDLYFAKQEGVLFLLFLLVPAILLFFIYRKE
jgi:hypothetical protein